MARLFRSNDQPGVEVDADALNGAFFGTLRSELEEDGTLVGAFAELAARFGQLREAYYAGRMDAGTLGRFLMDLRVLDDAGALWTIGATTGRWYRRTPQDGRRWVACPPPPTNGRLVDRFGNLTGWAAQDMSGPAFNPDATHSSYTGEDLSYKPAPEAPVQAPAGPTTPHSGRVLRVEDMFGTYVEDVTQGSEVDSSILPVEDLSGDDSWKKRYGTAPEDVEEAPTPVKRERGKRNAAEYDEAELAKLIRGYDGSEDSEDNS